MPYIINEDKALKALLSGITVADSGNPTRPVGVWFGQPDVEIRQQSYPYITIELVGISEAFDRAHRGYVDYPYNPEGSNAEEEYAGWYPIPVNLDYQVTTYARQPRHDRQMINALFAPGRLPLRFGLMQIPEDGTVRRVDMLGFVKRDTTEQDKRLFSNIYNVQVSSEFLPVELNQLYEVLTPPNITLNSQFTDFTPLEL
jgi:hypothetical protein